MKTKTSELTGASLDWAVAKCEGVDWSDSDLFQGKYQGDSAGAYSTDWAHGGPIIEREGIALYLYGGTEWNAHVGGKENNGSTPLIAAMRCYVASQLGDEVDIPEELK